MALPYTYHDYESLWIKHRDTLTYFHESGLAAHYDYLYKADTDTYIVWENLLTYLASDEISGITHKQPLQLGHRFMLPATSEAHQLLVEHISEAWPTEQAQSFNKHTHGGQILYTSGGSGYAMNRIFVRRLVEGMRNIDCTLLSAEDLSMSVCATGIHSMPKNTKDIFERERFHAFNPDQQYTLDISDSSNWWVVYHAGLSGIRNGLDCCSTESIAFHYVTPDIMLYIHKQLYDCRGAQRDEGGQTVVMKDRRGAAVIGQHLLRGKRDVWIGTS
eukprot:GHVQ01034635.1.p1 GENE.GHVQ01034635.1~~GHVQ01034635.1.p1  ORF type:complete len:315 (+),score=37.45 GHVQ01034635.1:126-947(+)